MQLDTILLHVKYTLGVSGFWWFPVRNYRFLWRDNFPWVLNILRVDALFSKCPFQNALFSKQSIQRCLYNEQLWKIRESDSLWGKGRARVLPIIKDSGSLSSGFISYNATRYKCKCHLVLFLMTCRNWGLATAQNIILILWSLLLLWIINYLCLWHRSLVSMKLWLANLLACK